MTFKPNLSVKEGLDFLAKRLDPIIAARLADDLGAHPWTVVLEILDQRKGYSNGRKYWTNDLQAQLRMLTERLGDFGYPFDDKQRTVSTLGNELRIVRNQLAHMHDFSIEEAFRANDFGVRLLDYFDDSGLDEIKDIRRAALVALASEEGVTEQIAAKSRETASAVRAASHKDPVETIDGHDDPAAEEVTPDPSVLVRESSFIGDKRIIFEPWIIVPVGDVSVLDELPKKAAKERVRAAAVEIATYEGPIHLDRLVQMIAQSFGLQRVRTSREKKLAYQVRQAGLFVDSDKFVWPHEIDPGSWYEFRPNDSTVDRPFAHISPVEIANAAQFLRGKSEYSNKDDLTTAVLQTFGRRRRTKQMLTRFDNAISRLAVASDLPD